MLEIVYENAEIWVVYKPAGLLVHASDIAEAGAENLCAQFAEQVGQAIFLVHRLDRPTAGLIMIAKSAAAAERYGQLFRDHRIQKNLPCGVSWLGS